MLGPVASNIHTTAHPDTLVRLHVIQETLQGAEAARTADQTAMQTDGQHLGSLFTFFVEHVKCVFQVGEEMIAGVETLRSRKAHVIAVQGVRHDQLRLDRIVAELNLGPPNGASNGPQQIHGRVGNLKEGAERMAHVVGKTGLRVATAAPTCAS